MASAVLELNQQRSDSSLASKSTRLHAQNDPISVDNPSGEKNNETAVKCNHFSIRGYVSEIRKRDPKLCYPFSPSKSTSEPRDDELPPMVVPKFKWWRCVGCVPEASSYCEAADKEVQKAADNVDASMLLVGQTSKVNGAPPRLRNAEASTSTDSNDNKNYSRSNICVDPKGKGKAHEEDVFAPPTGCTNGFLKGSLGQGILQRTTGGTEVNRSNDNEDGLRSRCNGNGIAEAPHKNCRPDHGIETGPSGEYMNREEDFADKTCQGKTQVSLGDLRADSPANAMVTEVAVIVNGSGIENKGRAVNLPDLNECSGEPPYEENHENMVTASTHNFCEDDDDYLGADHRKNPKVRLLSELLRLNEAQNETQNSFKGKRKNPSSVSSQDENVKRKRVATSQDEGSKSVEIRGSNNGTIRKLRASDMDIPESDSEDESTEIISEALAKRRGKSTLDKNPLLEKRNKKIKVDHGGPSMSRQKIIPKSSHEKPKYSDRVINLPRENNDVSANLSDRNSVLNKKKGKVLQAEERTSLIPHKSRVSRECAVIRRDEEAEQNANENAHHFSNSYVTKGNDQVCAPPVKDGFYLPPSRGDVLLIEGSSARKHKENKNVAEISAAFRTPVGASLAGSQFGGCRERNISQNTNSKEKQAGILEPEERGPLEHHTPLQVSYSDVNEKEPTNEPQVRKQDIDINSIPTDDKVTEQSPADDIPMDIVELMAKNQYERHLGDPKDKHNYPAPPAFPVKYTRENGVSDVYGECWQNFGQSHFLSMQKPPSSNPRNFRVNGFDMVSFNHSTVHGRGLPRESHASARFLGQEPIPPYSTRGLAANNWNRNMAAPQRFPPSFLQAMESYNRAGACSRQNTTEVPCVWPSVMASRMPMGITNPQMISQGSNVVNKGKINHQSSMIFNLGKQQNLSFSNAYNTGHAESSARSSVDMYSNDAIPAMHLLSLMQNGAKVQNAAALSLGPQQKVVGPTSSRQPFVENNSSRGSFVQHNSCHPCYPSALPTARPFASSFQNEGGIGRNNAAFVGPIPLTLGGQRNIESSHFAAQPHRRHIASSLEKGKGMAVISNPSYINNPLQVVKDSPKFLSGSGVRRDERTIAPNPEKEICKLNQNPSEFNDLKVLTRFMIGPEDLKPRGSGRERSARPKGDAKRLDMRMNKPIPSGKEREKQRKS